MSERSARGGAIMSRPIGLLRLPREVRFGFGARAAVASLASGFGERVAFVVDPFLADTDDFRAGVERPSIGERAARDQRAAARDHVVHLGHLRMTDPADRAVGALDTVAV